MATVDLSKLTAPNDALKDIRQLIFLRFLDPENYGALVDFNPSVVQGQKVGFVGQFGLMGKAAQGCNPNWNDSLLPTSEKEWDVPEWAIYEKLCWKDQAENTLLKYALANGTNVADLTDNDYMKLLVLPALQTAIENTVNRLIWFGDKDVTAYSSGNTSGALKEGVDAGYFNVTDGFFKRITKGVADGLIKQTVIEANKAKTFAAQKAAIRKAGVATEIFDNLIEDANPVLRQDANGRIYTTLALADALARDIRNNNKGSDLQWEAIFGGVKRTQYNGVEIVAVPFFDAMISAYYKADGDSLANPYRAIYTTKEQLMVGSRSEDAIANTEVWFDAKDEQNYLKARDSVGTLIKQEDLVSVAW